MKIPKTIKEDWRIHFAWIIAFTMMFACGLILWSVKENRALRESLVVLEAKAKLYTEGSMVLIIPREIVEDQVKDGIIRIYLDGNEQEIGK